MTAGRHIFIGDIHGCYDELSELLEQIAVLPEDVVASVGDLVRKGPRPVECVTLWKTRAYRAVLGNNEDKLLRKLVASNQQPQDPDLEFLQHPELIVYLRSLPLLLDFPKIDVSVVHGGLLPGMAISETDAWANRDAVLTLRYLRRSNGEWVGVPKNQERPGDPFWAEIWDGPRTIVYGHSPNRDGQPRLDRKAIGLDTGCVYGGRLTAAIFDGTWNFVSVPARQAYAP